jgi:hypothetical protein
MANFMAHYRGGDGHYANVECAYDSPIEERIGNLIGTIICLLLAAFFLWGYSTTIAAQVGLFR